MKVFYITGISGVGKSSVIEKLAENWTDNYEERISYKAGYKQGQQDNDLSKVTRFEVIDETGRVYTRHNCNIELSYQDDNRTLKVFVK